MVFTDKELINIILADIKRKENLRRVKGIGDIKYNKYSDELFDILTGNHEEVIDRVNKKTERMINVSDPFADFGDSVSIDDSFLD